MPIWGGNAALDSMRHFRVWRIRADDTARLAEEAAAREASCTTKATTGKDDARRCVASSECRRDVSAFGRGVVGGEGEWRWKVVSLRLEGRVFTCVYY